MPTHRMKGLILLSGLILPLAAKGPKNDDFSNAIALNDKAKITVEGSLTDQLDRFRATKQDGEPDHAGQKGTGSVWYSWTPINSRRVQIVMASENMDILLAVYTGDTLDGLSLVHRYENFAFPAFSRKRNEPFSQYARVEFQAEKGITYRIAIDKENALFEKFTLNLSTSDNPLNPELEIMEPGGKWEYLLATNDKGEPVDPKSLDEDFYHTWMFPERYDGPAFGKGIAPLGYGEINTLRIKSNLLGKRGAEPPKAQRYSSYARTSFTPILDISSIGIEGIIDDGAIIYLNGKEVARMNVASDQAPQNWQAHAKAARIKQISSEDILQYTVIENLDLPADIPVNLSLSLHNNNAKSTDMGLDIRIYSIAKKDVR